MVLLEHLEVTILSDLLQMSEIHRADGSRPDSFKIFFVPSWGLGPIYALKSSGPKRIVHNTGQLGLPLRVITIRDTDWIEVHTVKYLRQRD